MFLQLQSDNPNMSWVIQKNPASGMIAQTHKKGFLFGWFSKNDTCYNIYFEDNDDEISYKSEKYQQFEYLDSSRYISAKIPMNMISELLSSAFNEGHEEDVIGYKNAVMINMMSAHAGRFLNIFEKHFGDAFDFYFEHINHKNYRVTIETTLTIHELLNMVNLFCLFNTIMNDDAHLFIDENNIRKYLKIMNRLQAPYFIRYLFKTKILRSKEAFEDVKEELQGDDDIEMVYGDTWEIRYRAIANELSFENDVVDVGCGEGRYGTRIINQLKNKELYYIGIDVSEEQRNKAHKRISHKTDEYFRLYSSWDEYVENNTSGREKEVILSEVIEHMEPRKASEMISDILDDDKVSKLVVTTPNREFNPYYNMESELRREDHVFEPNAREFFYILLNAHYKQKGYSVEQKQVGDVVEGIAPTHIAIFEKQTEEETV